MERLKRFEYCGEGLIPYIEKALNLFHPEKKEDFLNNKYLQVVSSDKSERGFQLTFNKPVKSIIYLNAEKIEMDAEKEGQKKEDFFIYGIAHEIAHYFAGKGESLLLEKEANDWLKKYGNFNELIKKINHRGPLDEEKGYIYGYDYANKKDKDKVSLLEEFSAYLDLWTLKEFSAKKEKEIIDNLVDYVNATMFIELDNRNLDYRKGVAMGIMKRVREIADSH